MTRIVVISGESDCREHASKCLSGLGPVRQYENIKSFFSYLSDNIPDVLIVDADLPEDVLGFVQKMDRTYHGVPIVMFSRNAYPEKVVRFINAHAADFFEFPFDEDRLKEVVTTQAGRHKLFIQVHGIEKAYSRYRKFGNLVGISPLMQKTYSVIKNVATSEVTVLITGESGTGKELVAEAIHQNGPRAEAAFVPVNCAAIPRELLESELFGHEKGSFTGAYNRRLGSCEQAHNGTLFLDEVCEMDMALQPKMLRFLQDRSFTRVGGNELIKVNTRVIAATNRDPQEEVKANRLREDLFYRLNVVPIEVPPLRERPEDMHILAQHFLDFFRNKYKKKYFVSFSPEAIQIMLQYAWPGNVREMQNTIERIVVLEDAHEVIPDMFPEHMRKAAAGAEIPELAVQDVLAGLESDYIEPESDVMSIEEVERIAIIKALKKCNGDLSLTARKLGISRATLYRKIDKHSLR